MAEKELLLDVEDLVVRFETEDGVVRAVNGDNIQVRARQLRQKLLCVCYRSRRV